MLLHFCKYSTAKPTRFWKDVIIKKEPTCYSISLDSKPLKSPSGTLLKLPLTRHITAQVIKTEWLQKTFSPSSLIMTSLAYRALEMNPETRENIIKSCLRFLNTDTLLYRDENEKLFGKQVLFWDPIISKLSDLHRVTFSCTRSISILSQDPKTLDKLQTVLSNFDDFKLSAFEKAVLESRSFCIGLALVEKLISVNEAVFASRLEVLHQIERWGEVEDSHDVDEAYVGMCLGNVACFMIEESV